MQENLNNQPKTLRKSRGDQVPLLMRQGTNFPPFTGSHAAATQREANPPPQTSPNTSARMHLTDKHLFDVPLGLLQLPIHYLEPHKPRDIFPHGFDEHPQSQSASWNRSENDSQQGLRRLAESQADPLPESCVNPSWSIYAK